MQAMILKAKASADLPETGIKEGDTFYIVRDGNSGPDLRFRVVKSDGVKWVCSCGKGRCEHKFLVNEFLFKETQARWEVTGIRDEDLLAHVADELEVDR